MANKEEKERLAAALQDEARPVFLAIGLDEKVVEQSLRNPKFTQALLDTAREAGAEGGCPKAKGNLIYTVASKHPANALVHRPLLLGYVMGKQIKSNAQLDGAFELLKKVGPGDVGRPALEEAAGVGVVVSPEQVAAAVAAALEAAKERLMEERYHMNTNVLLAGITKQLKWADGGKVREALASAVEALLGPKTEADLGPPPEKKKAKAKPEKPKAEAAAPGKGAAAAAAAAAAGPEEGAAGTEDDPYAFMPKPEDNNKVHTSITFSDARGVMRIANSAQKLSEHMARTGGKVVTRFPPEPNGYLHIGHAKAMFVDFGMASRYGGVCYLRYDDTNPNAEKQEYIDHIEEIVSWMGWAPWQITYASDYFDKLYAYALSLIRAGHAFVCHQTKAEIEESREKKLPSPWRNRSVEENLRLFEDMRRGLYKEGEATLRMKMDYLNENPTMWDSVAYRIKYVEHPHAGDKWCIYPMYDYAHCLSDAIEGITHSLCTLEFEVRRASYYWLLEVLDTFKPVVWEYSRLNITNTVMSKRKLNRLVTDGHVNGWDDPRLLTLAGLRRRGVTPEAINAFCREIGITRNANVIPYHKLEHHVRAHLDATSPRALAVLRPLRVVLTNLPQDHCDAVAALHFPGRADSGYTVPFTRIVYIESTDFRVEDSKDYYGLAPGKTAMLRYACPITVTGYTLGADGCVSELTAEADLGYAGSGRKPPKGVLNWVGQPAPGREPEKAEIRLYECLFNSESPEALGDEWLGDINGGSLAVLSGAVITPELAAAKAFDRFQFERLGYFCVDPDSRPGALVFNRTVTLRDSFPKDAGGGGGGRGR
ncbi:MAG: tRNA synthetases class I, catalytic domain-containing protein [Monoraphidium minutum]|nr:MAG: tRNA synthetases class I, catalytic domain-containing protein [Monoraphidium minutum]